MKPKPRFGKADFRSSFVKILANTAVLAAFLPWLNKNPLFPKSATAKAERFRGIFVLIGRSNALCLARTSKAKSTEISRFAAGSSFNAHPIVRCPKKQQVRLVISSLTLQSKCNLLQANSLIIILLLYILVERSI